MDTFDAIVDSYFGFGVLALLLASACGAADLDIIFAADFTNSQPIQWMRHHPRAGGASIALGPAYVTALRVTNSGTLLTLYLQVPPDLNGNADYPLWSALKWFGDLNGDPPAHWRLRQSRGIHRDVPRSH
jgi:hypothetical protein